MVNLSNPGSLSIVATPIGHLQDITLRALETLKKVDEIICEDTRRTGLLLHHYEIKKSMIILNDYNEAKHVPLIISRLKNGERLALVSDAGTPLISDPGFKLVRECVKEGIKIESIPGPSAAITALTVSGLPTNSFFFVGYLSKKQGKRKASLMSLHAILDSIESNLKPTFILYEAPQRIGETLNDIKKAFGDIDIVICRELTKLHEEVRREKISESISHFQKVKPKGEFTILL